MEFTEEATDFKDYSYCTKLYHNFNFIFNEFCSQIFLICILP